MLFLYIFGPIVFTAFAWVKIHRYRKNLAEARTAAKDRAEKDRAEKKRFAALLAQAEQGNPQAQEVLVDEGWHSDDIAVIAFLATNKELVQLRRAREASNEDWKTYGEPAQKAYRIWQGAVGTKKEPALCVAFALAYDRVSRYSFNKTRARLLEELGFDYEEAKGRLQEVILNRYEMLTSRFSADKEAFLELRGLIPATCRKEGSFQDAGAPKLQYPEGWNKAVARFLENPAVGDFTGQGEGPARGQVFQWGEEAFRDGDPVKAKLVLAYANRHREWDEELTDDLKHELGMLVANYHASLVAETSATAEPSV